MKGFRINPKQSHKKNLLKWFLNEDPIRNCFLRLQWQVGSGCWDLPELGYVIQPEPLRSALGYKLKDVVSECVRTPVLLTGWQEPFKIYVTDSCENYHHLPGSHVQDYTGFIEVDSWLYGEKGPSVWDIVHLLREHYTHKIRKCFLCGCYDPVYFVGFQPVRDGIGCAFMHDKDFHVVLDGLQ